MSDGDVSEVEVVLDGVRFYVEARQDSTEHEVGSTLTEGLGSATDAIKTLGSHVAGAVKAIEPDHFSIQLGFEFKLEQGTLVAMLVRGTTTANVTVNLQWDRASPGPAAPRSASPGPAAPPNAPPRE
jgi:Trypsin-co-occurring domain 1